jgi:glycosyltransferase involved in cell wall biosynthesis
LISKRFRICVVGEWLHGHPDEGIHNLAKSLVDQWGKDHSVWTIRIGVDLAVNRFFLNLQLRKKLQDIQPNLIFYISPSSAKITALFRAKMLKVYAPQARVLVVALQPVTYNRPERQLLPIFLPDGIFVQSARSKELLQGIHCPVYFLPSGVDLDRFVPVEADQKIALRKRYGIDEKAVVILHVGHINRNRNIHMFSEIEELEGVRVLLVGSTSTPHDQDLLLELTRNNVTVIRDYLPHIEEVYQLADIYIFPVKLEDAAVGVPLSVIEALACNLPVISTPFGGLPVMFDEGDGIYYYENESKVPELISSVGVNPKNCTREKVKPYSWEKVAQLMLKMISPEEVDF